MQRRAFLKGMIGMGLATSNVVWQSPFNLFFREAHAQTALPVLVVVFQRGGSDGLNTIVPYGDPFYRGLRPTIAIAEPDPSDPNSALDLDGFYGLQPNLAAFLPIFQAGNMAILPTVQYPSPSRSHFDSQNFIESGIRADDFDGWLNRYLKETAQQASELRAVHFGGSLAQALRGDVPVSSFSSLSNFNLGLSDAEENALIDHVLPIYQQAPNPPTSLRQLVQDFGQVLFSNLGVVNNIDTSTYVPANNALYPNSTYGRQLREVAQLIKTPGVGLQIATINIGGWDTHSNQGGGETEGRQSGRFRDFADGIAALYTDLGADMDRVCLVSMTEFGRTCKENGSLGTDHGVGCVWTVINNFINGGMYPDQNGWPGLSDQDLISGRFLQFTTDYRDIMGDVLSAHLGSVNPDGSPNLDDILPGHTYTPLGLFA